MCVYITHALSNEEHHRFLYSKQSDKISSRDRSATMAQIIPRTITCKAAVVFKLGGEPQIEEIQVDPPKSSEVRIKMLYASLCHSDILCCKGLPAPLFPRIPGHERVGMVESIGEHVINVKEGDIVMPLYLGECGECPNCTLGKSNLCHKYPFDYSGLMPDGTSRMSINGETVYHHLSCSTWSEYIVIDVNYVVKVDPRLDLQHASLLACGFTTGFGAVWKVAEKGSSVAVLGLGTVGLGGLGTTAMIGVGVQLTGEINFMSLLCGRTLKGFVYGGVRTQSDLPTIVDKCKHKEIQLDELLTHEVPLSAISKAFEYFKQPDCVKVVIKF